MTRHEVREEMKQHEGNPADEAGDPVARQMAISRNRMIGLVSSADVVIVNPTHYAVALKYDAGAGRARGGRQGRRRHRQAASARRPRANGVPIVHEPVLTRTIYRACELGQLIPADLYEAVAQLLAFVFGLRAKGRAARLPRAPQTGPALTATCRLDQVESRRAGRRLKPRAGRADQYAGPGRSGLWTLRATDGARRGAEEHRDQPTASDRSRSPPRSSASW